MKGVVQDEMMVDMMAALTAERMVSWKVQLWGGKMVDRLVEPRDMKKVAWTDSTTDSKLAG